MKKFICLRDCCLSRQSITLKQIATFIYWITLMQMVISLIEYI